MITTYFTEIHRLLDQALETQQEGMEAAAQAMKEVVCRKKTIFTFGCSHAGILSQELFYRTGGLAVINPIYAPGLTLDVRPVTLTSEMERLEGYGALLVRSAGIQEGDFLLVHSVSGRNAVPVEAALEARNRGAFVAALTNLRYSRSVTPRASCGKRLYEVCDLVLDNCGSIGDAVCRIDGLPERVAASSTVVGAAMVNAIVARTVEILVQDGKLPPVFLSANVDGGDEHNAALLQEYAEQIHYL